MSLNIATKPQQDCMFRSLIFNSLTDKELELFDRAKIELRFKKGERVITEGQKIKELVYMKNGIAKLSKQNIEKKETFVSLASAKSLIGFLTVFSQDKYQYSITALTDSDFCLIDINVVKEIIKCNGAFALNILSEICNESDEIIYNRINISSKHLRGRIAHLLILLSEKIFMNTHFNLPLTRREIGELVNISTSNVIRAMSEFRKDGIIEIEDHTIKIKNFNALERIAHTG